METIDEILEELRSGEFARLADRIKVAVAESAKTTPTCKESLQVGNAAKMREALEVMLGWYYELHDDVAAMDDAMEKARKALSAPPRNCDKCLTPKDAMLAHLEEVYEGEKVEFGDYEWCEFVKWLFDEAKGDAK